MVDGNLCRNFTRAAAAYRKENKEKKVKKGEQAVHVWLHQEATERRAQ